MVNLRLEPLPTSSSHANTATTKNRGIQHASGPHLRPQVFSFRGDTRTFSRDKDGPHQVSRFQPHRVPRLHQRAREQGEFGSEAIHGSHYKKRPPGPTHTHTHAHTEPLTHVHTHTHTHVHARMHARTHTHTHTHTYAHTEDIRIVALSMPRGPVQT